MKSNVATRPVSFSRPLKKVKAETKWLLERTIDKLVSDLTLDQLVDRYKVLITRTWNRATRDVIIDALNEINSLGDFITRAELQRIHNQIRTALGEPVGNALRRKLVKLDESTYRSGAKVGERELGVTFEWGLKDRDALNVLSEGTLFWIGTHYDDFVQGDIQNRLNEYFAGGLNRRDLMLRIREDFRRVFQRSNSYWDLLADHTATKIREIGRVSTYNQANVRVIRVKARLDQKTTEFCRRAHGQVISIERINNQVDRYLDAVKSRDKAKVKEVWPWWSDAQAKKKLKNQADFNRYVKRGEIGLPPYHGRCRTRTVAEFRFVEGDRVLSEEEAGRGGIPLAGKKTRRRRDPGEAYGKPRPKRRGVAPPIPIDWSKKRLTSVKTAQDAEAWMEARAPGMTVDFAGITDPEAIEELIKPALKEFDRLIKKYPQIRDAGFVDYFGTQRGKKWRDLRDRVTQGLIRPRKFSFGRSVWAHHIEPLVTTRTTGARTPVTISINPSRWNDAKGLKRSMKRAVDTAFHPLGCTQPQHIITHEFDHVIWSFLRYELANKIAFSPAVGADGFGLMGDTHSMFVSKWDRPERLSTYARKDLKEGWAESSAAAVWGARAAKANAYVKAQTAFIDDVFSRKWYKEGEWKWFDEVDQKTRDAFNELRDDYRKRGFI